VYRTHSQQRRRVEPSPDRRVCNGDGLAWSCSSKKASSGCTAAYATSFSRTATLKIPQGDLVAWRAWVRHLVFLDTFIPSRFPPTAAAAAGAHAHAFQRSYCSAWLLAAWPGPQLEYDQDMLLVEPLDESSNKTTAAMNRMDVSASCS
jgi:hypothetical protein